MESNSKSLEKINKYVKQFNKTILYIFDLVKSYHKEGAMDIYENILYEIIKKKENVPITQFINNVYSNDDIRNNILEGNDDFFMNYEIKGMGVKKQILKKIFDIKKIWFLMSDDDKDFIKKSMLCLVKISDKYIFVI
jgi:hypothetical protein